MRHLKSTLRAMPSSSLRAAPTLSELRITGRTLQARRLRLWTASPTCAVCGRLTEWPHGFELDHIVRLADGGADADSNCQILCVYYEAGRKAGCHADKTAGEAK